MLSTSVFFFVGIKFSVLLKWGKGRGGVGEGKGVGEKIANYKITWFGNLPLIPLTCSALIVIFILK